MPELGAVARTPPAIAPATGSPPPDPRFLEPAGFVWGRLVLPDGAVLRWGHLAAAEPRADCVLALGFTEFVEKYFETIRDLAARGLSVWCFDWRGQGGSERPRRLARRPRARDFARDADDLAHFTVTVLPARHPRLLIAHSMGGAVALLCLHRHGQLFDAAVLSAPMIGLRVGFLPPILARRLTGAARVMGLGVCFLPGRRRWRPDRPPSPDRSLVSSDPERCRLQYCWFSARPELRLDGPTFGWLDAALRLASQIGQPAFLAAIATPILLGNPGAERLLRPEASRRAARLLPDCTLFELPDSRHEPFLERDAIRERWFAAIERFLSARLGGGAA